MMAEMWGAVVKNGGPKNRKRANKTQTKQLVFIHNDSI